MARTRAEGARLAEIEAVYRSEATRFVRLAHAVLGSDEEAWDAVQDAVAQAVRQRGAYRGSGSVEAWLWKIVLNAARSRRRRSTLREREREALARRGGQPWEEQEAVRRAVLELPERQRHVLFLRYYADLDYERIASVLEISSGYCRPDAGHGPGQLATATRAG